jgi:UDP-GlcNAc:undecaprenyl-phosphate GlcNAc-1-phosphate transferase
VAALAGILVIFVLAAALSWLLTSAVRALAVRRGLIDSPRQERWHRHPVPRLGGVAMYLTVAALLLWWNGPWSAGPRTPGLIPLLAGGTAIFLVGLIDDLRRLENRPKLVLLILCAVIPGVLGVRFELLPAVIGVPLAVLWILGATNAFNWLDNMDGVAGGVAVIASLHLVILSLVTGRAAVAPPAAIVGGAALGFLRQNFPPARIFMGDAGSGFLGFTLATLAVIGSYREVSNVLLTVMLPGLILAVPLFDAAMVTALRVLNRRPLFQGGRDHPAHRLVAMGLPERKVVLLLYFLSVLGGAIPVVAALVMGPLAAISVGVVLTLAFTALGLVLAEVHVYEGRGRNGAAARRADMTPLPAPLQNKRWVIIMLLDVVLVSVAFVSAHVLRFEGQLPAGIALGVAAALPIVLPVKMAVLYLAGIYRGDWRRAGLFDLIRLGQAVGLASVAGAGALAVTLRLVGVSRGALIIDGVLTLLLLGASRFSLQLVRAYLAAQHTSGRRVLIFGAGAGAMLLLQELRQNPSLDLRPVGFVDDDPLKQGTVIQGVPVLGTRQDLVQLIHDHRVAQVLVAAPSVPPEVIDEVHRICRAAGTETRRLQLLLD